MDTYALHSGAAWYLIALHAFYSRLCFRRQSTFFFVRSQHKRHVTSWTKSNCLCSFSVFHSISRLHFVLDGRVCLPLNPSRSSRITRPLNGSTHSALYKIRIDRERSMLPSSFTQTRTIFRFFFLTRSVALFLTLTRSFFLVICCPKNANYMRDAIQI